MEPRQDQQQNFIPPWPKTEPDPKSILPDIVSVRINAWRRVDATFAILGGQTVEQAYRDIHKRLEAGRLHPSSAVVQHPPGFYGLVTLDVNEMAFSRRVLAVGDAGKNTHKQFDLLARLAEAKTPEQAWACALEARLMRKEMDP